MLLYFAVQRQTLTLPRQGEGLFAECQAEKLLRESPQDAIFQRKWINQNEQSKVNIGAYGLVDF